MSFHILLRLFLFLRLPSPFAVDALRFLKVVVAHRPFGTMTRITQLRVGMER